MSFSELGLGEKLLEAIRDAGYTTPTPIQAQAIPFVLQGRDVMGCAQTGTGKTASFTLPMIELLSKGRARARMPRSLILEPTRELASQVQDNFQTYGAQHRLTTCLIIGGESMSEQTKKLERGVDVLIATPGRLIDQIDRGNIMLMDMKLLVVDECDRMLDMGFIPDIEKIVARLPKPRQTLMFSATMPPEIKRLADKFLSAPQEISVAPPATASERVEQFMVRVGAADKRAALRHLLKSETVKNAFIFCNRKRDIAILEKSLKSHGLDAGALHGDMPQSARQETLDAFKRGELTLMVCSDVAARGIDVSGVSHVFNFDVPHHAEDYVHRIGRTGRAGNDGRAFMLVTPDDQKQLGAIAKLTGMDIAEMKLDDAGFEAPAAGEAEDSAEPGRGRRRPARGRNAEPREANPRPAREPRSRRAAKPQERADEEAAADMPPPAIERYQRPEPDRQEPRRYAERRGPSDRYRRRDHEDDDAFSDASVVGFGNNIPAFLKIVPRLSPIDD